MKYTSGLRCTICNHIFPYNDELFTCPSCGEQGILDIEYDYETLSHEITKSSFTSSTTHTILKYQPLMSIEEHHEEILHVGNTPLYKAKMKGYDHIYIKDESHNPTQSLKDRASVVACLKALEANKTTISCSSTGNAASSLAGNAAKLGLKTVIFVPQRSPLGKRAQMLAYGALVVPIDGDYKATFDVSKKAIEQYEWYNRNAAINPHMIEGKKTVSFEIAEQLHFEAIDNVFVSVGDGCTIYGVYKGFMEFHRLGLIPKIPRIFGIQSSGCNPFVEAWTNQTPLKEQEENTIADSISVGIPRNPVKGLWAVTNSSGMYLSVTDDDIINAQQKLASDEGVFSEPAGAASYAGLLSAIQNKYIKPDETTVVIVTGNGLKDSQNYMARQPQANALKKEAIIDSMTKSNKPFIEMIRELHRKGDKHE